MLIVNITATKKHKIQEVMKGKPEGCFFEDSISIEDDIFSLLSMIQLCLRFAHFIKVHKIISFIVNDEISHLSNILQRMTGRMENACDPEVLFFHLSSPVITHQ